ncbi:MAG: GTPase Era [Candidatus Omnitrophota bacterium]
MKKTKFKSGYVTLLGKPNVGKSTILNYFLGQKLSIISAKPQTTRDAIMGIYSENNCQIIFTDTPGVHVPKTKLGECMMSQASQAAQDADLLVIILDAASGITTADQEIFKLIKNKKMLGKYVWSCVLINKIDLIKKNQIFPLLDQARQYLAVDEFIPVSGLSGKNLDVVFEKIKKSLRPGPAFYPEDQLTDKNERFIVAELIREQVLNLCHEEIPHSVAVEIQALKNNPGRKTLIQATIFLERQAQKKIIIGKQGQMLKNIGTAARKKIEEFLQRSIFLELWVKVHTHWRKDSAFLRRLGYEIK